ncbi:MAG: TauD/TfdA family dioxygenase [Waterburya sp.]
MVCLRKKGVEDNFILSSIYTGGLTCKEITEIVQFKALGNKKGFLLIRNTPIGLIPPTPINRNLIVKDDLSSEKLIIQATILLGDLIGYVQESNGDTINNLFPMKSKATDVTSDSCDTELELHTENAFHAIQPDYLVLLCLRQDPNNEAVTYISSVDSILTYLDKSDIDFFFNEKYSFLSDYCKTQKNCRIDINKRHSILYGDISSPYFRFDPDFMIASSYKAQKKMELLRNISWKVAKPIKLKTGDLLIIDNRKTAHARSRFSASFDGTDRWLQRTFALCHKRFLTEKLGTQNHIFELVTEL